MILCVSVYRADESTYDDVRCELSVGMLPGRSGKTFAGALSSIRYTRASLSSGVVRRVVSVTESDRPCFSTKALFLFFFFFFF